MLDAPESHAVLSRLLPRLGNLIHDKNKKVRLAVVTMLQKVKSLRIRGIKYHQVVNRDHLIARLAEEGRLDNGEVALALSRLLQNVYVPVGAKTSGLDQIKRTIQLTEKNPDAAAVFYSNLAYIVNIADTSKLAVMLLHGIHAGVMATAKKMKQNNKRPKEARKRRLNDENSEEDDDSDSESDDADEEAILDATNTALVARLVETICILWESILVDLEDARNSMCKKLLMDNFSGKQLNEIFSFFENRSLDGENQAECNRVCAAVLRCAGHLENSYPDGLAEHINSRLKKISKSGDQTSSIEHIASYFVLLCQWGSIEDVAEALSSSITSAFEDAEVDELTLMSPESNQTKKRKSTRRSDGRGSTSSHSIVPTPPPSVAIKVVERILHGRDYSCKEARDILFSNAVARDKIQDALYRSTLYARRLLRAPSVSLLFTSALGGDLFPSFGVLLDKFLVFISQQHSHLINESNFEFVMELCETYGRFSLHKAASSALEDGSKMDLNGDAKYLLEWTTEQILPAFNTDYNGNPLQDLDLSRISFVNDSMVSLDVPSPGVTPVGPPRKKGDMRATPEKLEGTFGSLDGGGRTKGRRKDSKIIPPGEAPGCLVRSAVLSLLQNSCILFAEWLAVGEVSESGAKAIEQAAMKWSMVLELSSVYGVEEDNKENPSSANNKAVQHLLLPAFYRLAVYLCKTSSRFDLFKKIVIDWSGVGKELEKKDVDPIVESIVRCLLQNTTIAEKTVDAILDMAYDATKLKFFDNDDVNEEEDHELELPESMSEVVATFPDKRAATHISISLSSVLKRKAASLYLAKKLADNFVLHARSIEDDKNNEKALLFEVQCLWMVCESGACRSTASFKGSIKKVYDTIVSLRNDTSREDDDDDDVLFDFLEKAELAFEPVGIVSG